MWPLLFWWYFQWQGNVNSLSLIKKTHDVDLTTSQFIYKIITKLVLSFLKPPKACFPVFVFVQWKLDSVFWKQKVENTSQITITLVGPTIFRGEKNLLKTAYPNISISHSQPFNDRYIGGEWYVGFKPQPWSTIIRVIFL